VRETVKENEHAGDRTWGISYENGKQNWGYFNKTDLEGNTQESGKKTKGWTTPSLKKQAKEKNGKKETKNTSPPKRKYFELGERKGRKRVRVVKGGGGTR